MLTAHIQGTSPFIRLVRDDHYRCTLVQLEHLSCIFLCPYSCFINIIRIDALTALVRSVKDTRKCGEPRLGTVSDSDTPTDARGAAASTRTGRFWECFRDNPIS